MPVGLARLIRPKGQILNDGLDLESFWLRLKQRFYGGEENKLDVPQMILHTLENGSKTFYKVKRPNTLTIPWKN